MSLYLLILHSTPNQRSKHFKLIGGAFITVVCQAGSADEAKKVAAHELADWDVLEVDLEPQSLPRHAARNPPAGLAECIGAAQQGGIGCKFVTYPLNKHH